MAFYLRRRASWGSNRHGSRHRQKPSRRQSARRRRYHPELLEDRLLLAVAVADDGTGFVDIYDETGTLFSSFDGNFATGDLMVAGDIDGDEADELLIAHVGSGEVEAYELDGTLVGQTVGANFAAGDGLAVGDVDILTNYFTEVLIADDTTANVDGHELGVGPLFSNAVGYDAGDGFAAGDTDGDLATAETVVADPGTGNAAIYDASGALTGTIAVGYSADDGFAIGDVDGDAEDEIVVANDSSGNVESFNADGTSVGSFASGFGLGDGFDAGDTDGDGTDEIAIADAGTGTVQLLDQTGAVQQSFSTSYDSGDGFVVIDVRRLGGVSQQGIATLGQMFDSFTPRLLPEFPNLIGDVVPGFEGIPFVEEAFDDVLDFTDLFGQLANRLVAAPAVAAVVPPDLSFTDDQTLVLQLNGLVEVEVPIAGGPYASTAALVDHINNVALASTTLNGLIVASDDGGLITLSATSVGIAELVSVATLRLTAPNPAAPFGQLGADTTFSLDIHRDVDKNNIDEIETYTFTLYDAPVDGDVTPATNDNVDTSDLVSDLNLALLLNSSQSLSGLFDVFATIDPVSGNVVLAASDPDIKRMVIYEANAGEDITGFGFVDGGPESEVDELYDPGVPTPPTSPLGLVGVRGVAGLKYDSIATFETVLATELASLSDAPLPGGFDVDAQYDEATDTITFNLALNKQIDESIALDFDQGFDLGPLGTVEVVADAEATFTTELDFQFRAGMFLGSLGSSFSLTGATLLSDLNAGAGVPINVGLTATNAGPGDGKLAADVVFDLSINGAAPVVVSIDDADTTSDNFDLFALAEDINDALAVAGVDTLVEAGVNTTDGKLTLTGIDGSVVSLEVTDSSNLAELGFISGQQGDRFDMTIRVNFIDYDVDLDGATTVGDAIALIEAQAPVTVLPNSDKGLTVTATTIGHPVEISTYFNADLTPAPAATALGILGGDGTDTLVGTPLHGETLTDRVFIVEPAINQNNITLDVDVQASGITLSAALGLLGLTATDTVPLQFSLDTNLRLIDPGTQAADGRITLQEMLGATALADIVEFDTPTTALAGELQIASPLLGELNNGGDTFATITIGGDLFDPEFTASFNDEALDGLKNLSISQILDVVRNVVESLQSSTEVPWMDEPIPLVGKSLSDVMDFLDNLVDKVDEVLSSFDLNAIRAARDAVQTAIGDIALDFEARADMFRALDRLTTVVSEAFAAVVPPSAFVAASTSPEIEQAKSRLVAAAREMRWQIDLATNALLPSTPGLNELQGAIDQLESLIPDLESLETRLEEKASTELSAVLGVPVDFRFDFVDYDGNTAQQEHALIIGIDIDGSDLIDESFAPDLSLPVFGPVQFQLAGTVDLYAGGQLSLGFGARFDDTTFEPFVIVDPPTAGPFVNPDLFETRLDLNAGFEVQSLTGQVRFGNLELLQGEVDLLLTRGVEDTQPVTAGGTVALSAAPVDANSRLVVVKVDGETSIRGYEDYSISGTTLTFAANAKPVAGTQVTVAYRTSSPGDPENNVADRAAVGVEFNHPVTDGNTIGAVSLADFIGNFGSQINVTADGVITGAVDAEFLNSVADDVVTLAVNINDPLDPLLVIDETALTEMFENVDFDLVTIVDGIIAFLDLVEEGLTSDIVAKLPMVGGALDTSGTFIGKLNDDYVEPFRNFLEDRVGSLEDVKLEVQQFVFDTLGSGPNGIDILGDRDGNGQVELADVEVDLDKDAFQIVVTIAGSDESFVDFDSGLKGVPIDFAVSGGVRVGWDYEIDFGVGASRTSGFYFVLNNDTNEPEFDFNIDIGLKVDNSGSEPVPTSAGLSLFGLNLTAEDVLQPDGRRGTGLEGSLALNVSGDSTTSPFGDEALFLSEITSKPFYETFEASLSASVVIDLLLEANINKNLPSLQTELYVGWGIDLVTGPNGIEVNFDGLPELEFRDITLNFGDFLGRIIGPVVNKVDELIEPIKPVVKFLRLEVPGLSQLSQLAGRGPVTFLDLAFIQKPEAGATAKKFLGVVDAIITIVDALADLDENDQIGINFGTVTIGAGNGIDLDNPLWNSDDGSLDGVIPGFLNPNPSNPNEQVNGGGSSKLAEAMGIIERKPDASGQSGLGIGLEILKAENLIKLLIGQTANIITWDIPILQVDFTLEQSFRPIAPIPLVVGVGFDLGAFADFSVGFDTRGIQTGNFLDGFFFGDLEDVISGPDIDEMGLSIGVRLRAALDLAVASAGIEGELVASILANWNDQDGDGKLYLDEIANIVEQDGIDCVFDLRGELRAIVRLVWKALWIEGSKDIIDVVVFEFENECPKYEVAHVSDGGESLPGGFTSVEGDLIVHGGGLADQRQPGVTTDVAEEFTLTNMAPGVIEVDGMGFTQRYGGVKRIYVDGGKGSDKITLVGVTDMDAILRGGEGDDLLISGGGNDTVEGGGGNDVITTGLGDDTIDAGSGDDMIDSGAGADTVDAGAGIDDITTGSGADTIDAGSGNDTIDAGTEDDTITAGPGDDVITAGPGNDTVYGDAGIDIITGDAGNDEIYGGLGADNIQGNDGNDTIYGDGGNDIIVGQIGNDILYGGPGRDRIDGDEGNDEIHGGSGADTLTGFIGNDQIFGDAGNDLIEGDDPNDILVTGDDLLVGGNDNDLLVGGPGDDDLFGGYGDDVILSYILGSVTDPAFAPHYIEGGPNDDFICGTTVGDEIYGGTADTGYLAGYVDPFDPPLAPLAGGFSVDSCVEDTAVFYIAPPSTSVSGTKFEDVDGNGVWDNGEPGLGGFIIQLVDDQGEVADETVTSDGDGSYSFTVEDPGTYTLREVQEDGFFQTFPALPNGEYADVVLAGGAVTDLDFGNLTLASVHGTKWRDDDKDGERDEDEPGLAGVFVFADANGNGVWDVGTEKATFTMADDLETEEVDETGQYWLKNLMPGTYEILEVVPAGYEKTYPVREIVYENQFEQVGVGSEWSSTEKEGLLATDRTPQNQRGFLGQETGGESEPTIKELLGSETLTLQTNNAPVDLTALDIEFDLFTYGSWDGNDAAEGLDRFKFRVDGGPDLLDTTFSNIPGVNQAYPDMTGGGSNPAQTGAAETSTLGYDRNGLALGKPGFTPADAVYQFNYSQLHAGASLQLQFEAILQDAGLPDFEYWGIDNLRVSYPIEGHTVTLTSGETREGLDFGNWPRSGEIHGDKFHDLNGDGVRDPGEPGLGGVTIYVDSNGDGRRNIGELRTETMQIYPADFNTDGLVGLRDVAILQKNLGRRNVRAADLDGDGVVGRPDAVLLFDNYGLSNGATNPSEVGDYWLTGLLPGDYAIAEIPPEGFVAVPNAVYRNDFAATPGSEWSNGLISETPIGSDPFLGQFGNETVSLSLAGLEDHTEATVSFDLLAIGMWDGVAGGAIGPDQWSLAVQGGPTLVDTTFSNDPAGVGQNFPDDYPGPINAPQSGAVAVGSLGYSGPTGPADSVYRLSYTFEHSGDSLNLDFAGMGLDGVIAAALGETWGLDNVEVTIAGGQRIVSVAAGQIVSSVDIPNTRPGGVTGTKWRDDNGNSEPDAGEPRLGGVTIYSDLNGNGRFDANEPSAITTSGPQGQEGQYTLAGLLPGKHSIREVVPEGMVRTFPAVGVQLVTIASGATVSGIDFGNRPTGSIHGTKFDDLDGDGKWTPPSEPGLPGVTIYADLNGNGSLDSWEPSTTTMNDDTSTKEDEAGRYWLENVPPGTVAVREVVPQGYTQTFPVNPDFYTVQLVPDQPLTGLDFGNRRVGDDGEVRGVKWEDLDGDGRRGSTPLEPGMAGVTIYADLDNSGTLDPGEPSTVTMSDDPTTSNIDETGLYWLTGVPTGTALIREEVPLGFLQTYPTNGAYSVTIDPGTVLDGLDFGNMNDPNDGEVSGLKWDDANGNGLRNFIAGTNFLEPGIPEVTIYADLNRSGKLDPGEPSTTTMFDDPATTTVDEAGMYWLRGLPIQTVTIQEVIPPGMTQTFPSTGSYAVRLVTPGQIVFDLDFGNQMSGPAAATAEAQAAPVVAAGAELSTSPFANNDCYKWTKGTISIPAPGILGNDLSPPLEVSWYTQPQGGGSVTVNPDGSFVYDRGPFVGLVDTFMYRAKDLNSGLESNEAMVGFYWQINDNFNSCFVEAHGTKWNDTNGDGKQGQADVGMAGVTIYADLNNNGSLDVGEPSTVTMEDDPQTQTDETGMYWLTGVPVGQAIIREVVPEDMTQTYPNGAGPDGDAYILNVFPGTVVEGLDFGNAKFGEIIDGADEIYGADGDDLIYGDNLISDPLLTSIGDDDLIFGVGGMDTIFGQEEKDTISGGPDADTIDGGVEIDRVVQTVDADQVLLDVNLSGQGPDILVSIERATLTGGPSGNSITAFAFTQGPVILYGGAGNDTLIGTNNDDAPGSGSGDGGDQIYGQGGNDFLRGADGDDQLDGGAGSDTLEGQNDDDLYWFGPAPAAEADTVAELAGGGHDTMDFTALPVETLTLDLGAGNGNHGARTITVSGGDAVEDLFGGPGVNLLTGSAADNLIVGNSADDVLKGLGGDDTLRGKAGKDQLDGGAGDDSLYGGTGANDQLEGGPDNDKFIFEPGWGTATVTDAGGTNDTFNFSTISDPLTVTIGSVTVVQGGNTVTHLANEIDRIVGGSDDDQFIFSDGAMLGPAGSGTIDGGPGTDVIDYSAYTSAVTVDLSASTATGTGGVSGLENIIGGTVGDSLTGDAGPNAIQGLGGDDTISGGAGNDVLLGGDGDEVLIRGDAGDDLINGGPGSDNIEGGTGSDHYLFGAVTGGAETDTLTEVAAAGNDTIDFASLPIGNDLTIDLTTGTGSHLDRTLVFVNPERFETIRSGAGDDSITGNDAADNLVVTGDGDDVVNAKGGSNTARGGDGDDTYLLELGASGDTTQIVEEIGAGTDTLDFSLMTIGVGDGVAVDLSDTGGLVAKHTADATRQVTTDASKIIFLENVVGSDGADTLIGSAAANVLSGGDGGDTIDGGFGDDVLDGGDGDDTLYGGRNEDTLMGGAGSNDLYGGPHDDRYLFVTGGTGTDTLLEDPAEIIGGSAVVGGTDTLDFSQYATSVTFDLSDPGPQAPVAGRTISLKDIGGSADAENFENVVGSPTAVNTLTGNSADNVLTGGSANDLLTGGAGDDTLLGKAGNDQLFGEAGADILPYDPADTTSVDGGADDDTLRLGSATTLDLSAASQLAGIEKLDLTNAGVQDIKIDNGDVVAISDTNLLTITGGGEDVIRLVSTWALQTNLPVGFDTYTRAAATVQVDQPIPVTTPVAALVELYSAVGDLDFDGDVDVDDSPWLVLGLTRPEAYEQTFGVPASLQGDTDQDGDVDFDDIAGFAAALAGETAAAGSESDRAGLGATDVLFGRLGADRNGSSNLKGRVRNTSS